MEIKHLYSAHVCTYGANSEDSRATGRQTHTSHRERAHLLEEVVIRVLHFRIHVNVDLNTWNGKTK